MSEDRIYAGDIVYDDLIDGRCRAEIIELLSDVCSRFFPCYPKGHGERLSEGSAIDTILLLLDVAVKPDEIWKFRECLRNQITE